MKQSENITINASPERVRTALTDLEDRVRWGDRLHGMSTLDGRETAPGSRMRIGLNMSRFKVTVTAFDPPTRMASGARNPLMSYFPCLPPHRGLRRPHRTDPDRRHRRSTRLDHGRLLEEPHAAGPPGRTRPHQGSRRIKPRPVIPTAGQPERPARQNEPKPA